MRTAKRILTLFMVMVMAMTAFSVTAGAGIADTAKSITSGKAVTTTLYYKETADYKINVSESGSLNLNVKLNMDRSFIYVYDVNGNQVKVSDFSYVSSDYSYSLPNYIGDGSFHTCWNETVEQFSATITYKVSKGTYYIRIKRNGSEGDGKVNFTATFPSSSSSTSTGKVSYLTLTMSKGWSLQLGAVVSPTGKKVTWKSSKKSVVSVSSSGLITAKKKGTAIITAKCGSSTKKIKIIVK